ncbi:MAG: hypothetical protein EXS13_04930 [Planctomycetes bacterium]|nr:hypothetical protein [Planctomycetota bacterium]
MQKPLLASIAALVLFAVALCSELAAAPARPACQEAVESVARRGTVVVPIRGPLSEEMVALTIRALRRAQEMNARAIVFEIDTEGGDLELMDRLVDEFEKVNDLETIAYVTQKAASAGALIAISCKRLYMRPGANIGSALLLFLPQKFGIPLGTVETLRDDNEAYFKKILRHFQAHFRAKAQANDRPAALAEAFVWSDVAVLEIEVNGDVQYVKATELEELAKVKGEESIQVKRTICKADDILNLTAQEAYDTRMIDGMATTREDLLEQLGLAAEPVEAIEPSWSERLAGFLQSFGLAFLIAGLIAIFVEIKLPGFGLPGVIGIVCLGLWMFGKYLAGLAEMTEVLLVVAGFGLIAVEIFVLPGTMIAGIAGAIGVIAGLVMATQQTLLPDSSSPFAEGAWWSATNSMVLSIAGSAIGMVLVAMFLPRIPFLNRAILRAGGGTAALTIGAAAAVRTLDELAPDYKPTLGARGVALTVLRPAGKVKLDGRELDAVSEGAMIDRGRAVVVVALEPGRLVVRGAGPEA